MFVFVQRRLQKARESMTQWLSKLLTSLALNFPICEEGVIKHLFHNSSMWIKRNDVYRIILVQDLAESKHLLNGGYYNCNLIILK
jgi:hypothetical protein